jgi:zona occludens toxin
MRYAPRRFQRGLITLWTGEPGDGKSNRAISVVKEQAEREKRPVFFSGIEILDPVALPWKEIKPDEWHLCPIGSIVVLDECQDTFEPRQRGKPHPEFARELMKHRHSGIDLHMITQHPTLIDAHDRKAVGTHNYVRRKPIGGWKTVYRFKGCVDYPEKSRSKALDSEEVLDNKAAFAWYKSTEQNTHKAKIPKRLWLLVFCIVAVPALLFNVAHRVMARQEAEKAKVGTVTAAGTPLATQGSGAAMRGSSGSGDKLSAADYVANYTPRVRGLEHTAPAFDGVTAPVVAPYPAACLTVGTRCGCYTQQGTALDVPPDLCLAIVQRGFFVTWQAPPTPPPSSQDRIGGLGGTPSNKAATLPGPSFVPAVDRSLADAFPGGVVPARRSLANGRSALAPESVARGQGDRSEP